MKLSKIKDVAVTDVQQVKKVRRLVPVAVTRRLSTASIMASKNSPQILFAAGVVGFGATVVLACRATLRLEEVLEETTLKTAMANEAMQTNPNYTKSDHKHDMAYLRIRAGYAIVKLYTPAVIMGSLSVAALTGSHHILSKRNAGLTAAYAATEKAFADYRDRVREELGEEKEREIKHGVEERTEVVESDNGPKKKKVRGFADASQYAVVFEEGNANFEPTPEYNLMFIRTVQNQLNDQLHATNVVLLNDAYEALGFERTSAGAVVGWVRDADRDGTGDGYIDFGVFTDENRDRFWDYVTNADGGLLIDFNVDGVVFEIIDDMKKRNKKKRGNR